MMMTSLWAGLLAMATAQMRFADLTPSTPEYVDEHVRAIREPAGNGGGDYYVFLQKFPLRGYDNLFFATEVLVCARDGFSDSEQSDLDGKIDTIEDYSASFVHIDTSWWTDKGVECVELGYGGSSSCVGRCCSVPRSSAQQHYPLNSTDSIITNSDGSEKQLFIYGAGDFDGSVAWHHACDEKCWSNWAGGDYNYFTNNCNTFTSAILSMVYGLYQEKPSMGLSDMVTVHGDCPARTDAVVLL